MLTTNCKKDDDSTMQDSSFLPTSWTKGDGSENNPYQIEKPGHLVYLANIVNSGNESYSFTYFILMNDLDLSSISWTPIGLTYNDGFGGNFDGNNKSISNLNINSSVYEYTGLFGHIYGGSIKNLKLVNVDVTGNEHVGGFVGYGQFMDIENCSVSGSVSGANNVGAIGGKASSTDILNCYNEATVHASGNNAGGLIGDIYNGEIYLSFNLGTITAHNGAGGLIGHTSSATSSTTEVKNCYNKGSISATDYAAGIIGSSDDSDVRHTYNVGTITATTYIDAISVIGPNGYTSTVNVEFSYYLDGTLGTHDSYFGVSREQAVMLSSSFVDELNEYQTPEVWEMDKTPNINDGYPILPWQ